MRTDCLVYLSGPITPRDGHTLEANLGAGLRTFLELLRRGVPAFCPHLTGDLTAWPGVPYETWMAYDLAVLARCTHMLLLPRWESSPGAVRERELALRLALPVAGSLDRLLEAIGGEP